MIAIHWIQLTASIPVIRMDDATASMVIYLYGLSVVMASMIFGVVTLIDSAGGGRLDVSGAEYALFLILSPLPLIVMVVLAVYAHTIHKAIKKYRKDGVWDTEKMEAEGWSVSATRETSAVESIVRFDHADQ